MKKSLLSILLMLFFMLCSYGQGFAGQADAIIDKLVEKEIISKEEAKKLLCNTSKDDKCQIEENCSLPEWLQNLKINGDLRLRYQNEEKDTTASGITTNAKRERARARFRLGLTTKVAEGWTVKAGIATGSSDPRSTNQTLQDQSSSKSIQLDYAYAKYKPCEYAKVMAGKIQGKKTLWMPSDLLWDSDINPEGVAVKLQCDKTGLWANTGYFILDEMSSGSDPSMFFIQPGISLNIDDVKVKGSFNYYATNSVKGLAYSNIVSGAGTNTTETSPASFKYDYDCWGFSGEVAKNNLIKDVVNYGAVFFDYINNPDPSDENIGYLVGIKFGDKKVKKAGDCQAKILYRKLGKDAWLDFLPNADVLGGQTDAKGYQLGLKHAIAKNVVLGLTYYSSETIKSSTKEDQDLLQIDCLLKF